MSLGSWHSCSACFPHSPALPPPQLFLPNQETAQPGWETQSLPMQGRAGSSSPGATCHPGKAKVIRTLQPSLPLLPALINHFSSGAHSQLSSCRVPAVPSKSFLNKAWATRTPASNCGVSKPYCLLAIFYKLIVIFIGTSVHDKKRWVEVREIHFYYKPNPTLNHCTSLFLLLSSPQACEDLSYPTIFITAEFCRSATSWPKKLYPIFI